MRKVTRHILEVPEQPQNPPSDENCRTAASASVGTGRALTAACLAVMSFLLVSVGAYFTWRDSSGAVEPLVAHAVADSVGSANTSATTTAAAADTSERRFLSLPIRDLQVMHHRVMAHNPLRDEVTEALPDIVPDEWRVVTLHYAQPDGSLVEIQRGLPRPEQLDEPESSLPATASAADLSRAPLSAVDEFGETITVGDIVPVVWPEHGIDADFTVVGIEPCPVPMPGDGHLVTTKFIHHNAEVHDLRITGSAEVIGTTSGHPFWSEDRQDFFPISDFRPGERLLTATGQEAALESLTPRPQRETVYNVEVDGEHVYSVGADGKLVHNACGQKRYITYRGIDPKTGKVYVGRASGPASLSAQQVLKRRLSNHKRVLSAKVHDEIVGNRGRNSRARLAISGKEQELMDRYARHGKQTRQIRGYRRRTYSFRVEGQ